MLSQYAWGFSYVGGGGGTRSFRKWGIYAINIGPSTHNDGHFKKISLKSKNTDLNSVSAFV